MTLLRLADLVLTSDDFALLSIEEGRYRVAYLNHAGLESIGETGRSLHNRVNALARRTFANRKPYREPHTVAPCLWDTIHIFKTNIKIFNH